MTSTVQKLMRLREHCALPNWNGYHAHPISVSSLNNAKRLAETVFVNLPDPHVGVDNLTGQISFQWGDLRRRSMTLFIGANANDPIQCLKGNAGVFSKESFSEDAPSLVKEVEECR